MDVDDQVIDHDTSVSRHADRIDEERRMSQKFGSLLDGAEDVERRKQVANVAFRRMWTVWLRLAKMSKNKKQRLALCFKLRYGRVDLV